MTTRRRPSGFWTHLTARLILSGISAVLLGIVALWLYTDHLVTTHNIKQRLERPWSLPARVYARPLELQVGLAFTPEQFADELRLLQYKSSATLALPGSFRREQDQFDLLTRRFTFWDGREPARRVRVAFKDNQISELTPLDGEPLPATWRLEPIEIAAIYPEHLEDRILVRRVDMPPALIDALLAVEDQAFYRHFGVNPRGIARAAMANYQAGRAVQGGSTITQQLVKNLFLTNERSFRRKIEEILMAVYIDAFFPKEDILDAYLNEVYLGQDGGRAIHGFGLASRFYFNRDVAFLGMHQIALLVGMVRGPVQYNPRRDPAEALNRRNLVLDVMVEQRLLSADDGVQLKKLPLDIVNDVPRPETLYPAFVDLVKRQLNDAYRDSEWGIDGLKVFSTLDPRIQNQVEESVLAGLAKVEKGRGLRANSLQTAAILAQPGTGEVFAVVGDREVRRQGFNRALNARRSPGSLLKPVVYLMALEQPDRYTLTTRVQDSPFRWGRWSPKNADRRYRGPINLMDALALSRNLPVVRLGHELGLDAFIQMMARLGVDRPFRKNPAMLLGGTDTTLLEVTQMYMTMASGGFHTPLRTIVEVTGPDGEPLERSNFESRLQQATTPGAAYLVTRAMQRTLERGTARAAYKEFGKPYQAAGKTGTTSDYRDSWFAGYTGSHLAVVWVGRDDNRPTRLSGANGAMPVWMNLMRPFKHVPLDDAPPSEIEMINRCGKSIPYLIGSTTKSMAGCI